MRPARTAALALVACLALAGCDDAVGPGPDGPVTSEAPSPTTDGPSVQRAGGSVILVSAEVDGGMDALMSGVVVRTDAGCLALGPGESPQPVLWPHGSTLSADGTSVEVPGFGAVAVGDEVWSGGGSVTAGRDLAPELPEECVVPGAETLAALQGMMEGPPPGR